MWFNLLNQIFLCVAPIVQLSQSHTPSNPIVETVYGRIIGKTAYSREGRGFYSFTKIPYAKPPTGENRFRVSSGTISV